MAESFEWWHYRQESTRETNDILDFSMSKPIAYRHWLWIVTEVIMENKFWALAWFDIVGWFWNKKDTWNPPKSQAWKDLIEFDLWRWWFTFLEDTNMINTSMLPAYIKELESKLK